MSDSGVSRRDLLKKVGLGGAAFIGGTVVGRTVRHAEPALADEPYSSGLTGSAHGPTGDLIYMGHHSSPAGLGPDALDSLTFPPAPDGKRPGTNREIEMRVEERLIEIAHRVHFEAWTYNGSVPAPIIRATEGDLLRIHFTNPTAHAHSLHFHGSHRPDQDGWEPVPPGGETIYEIEAGPAGVHPFHCHTTPLAEHVARGLYGMLIVDPVGGRGPAQEVALLLSGFSSADLGTNGVVAWNGVSGYYHQHPIKVEVGERVRAYVVNMVEHEPVASIHLHAQTFDVFPAGMGSEPAFREDTITLGQGQRAMIEFTLPQLGRYMFHPHQHWLAERGAMGWFAAV